MVRPRLVAALRATVSGRRGDDGAALVMVLGVLMVTAVVAVTIASASLFATRTTVGTRAAVQARAAAEAGIDVVASQLFGSASTCAGPTVAQATAPTYSVAISYKSAGYAGTVWTNGCPPADASAVRLVSTGTAASTASGAPAQNTRQVEQVWTRNTAGPAFTKAIFGDLSMALNTNMVVNSPAAGANDADVFTNGDFTCSSAMNVKGDLYVKGNALWSSNPCTVAGDVYIEGNFTCPDGTTIGGNLYVQGNFKSTGNAGAPCKVAKDLWAGGTGTTSTLNGTVVGGSFLIKGNYSLNGNPAVTGAIRVGGAIADGVGAFWSRYPTATQHDGGVGTPPTIPASADNTFPQLTTTASQFAGWTPVDWTTARRSTLTASTDGVCSPYSGSLSKPLTIASNTVLDTRSACPSGVDFNGLRVVLYADAVVFVAQYKQAGATEIVSGDGQPHSLYIVNPWTSAGSTCSSASTGIEFTWGTWTQGPNTKVMLYTAGRASMKLSPGPTIRGQIYACSVAADTGFTLTYDPVGAAGASPGGLQALTLGYTRDL